MTTLCQSMPRLVAAEGGGRPRQLLPLALGTLLQCCGEEGGGQGEETEDSTASHALHVLRGQLYTTAPYMN